MVGCGEPVVKTPGTSIQEQQFDSGHAGNTSYARILTELEEANIIRYAKQ